MFQILQSGYGKLERVAIPGTDYFIHHASSEQLFLFKYPY